MAGRQLWSQSYVENGCRHKIRYDSKVGAKRAAARQQTSVGGRPLAAYKCLACSEPGYPGWHVGHPFSSR